MGGMLSSAEVADRAGRLLSGPAGRACVARLAGLGPPRVGLGEPADRLVPDEDLHIGPQAAPWRLLKAIAPVVEAFPDFDGDWRNTSPIAWRVAMPQLLEVAQTLARRQDLAWWWAPVDHTRQVFLRDEPAADRVLQVSWDQDESTWWVTGLYSLLPGTTHGPVGPLPSVEVVCREDAAPRHPHVEAHWPVPDGPVLEITTARDWTDLTARFPRVWAGTGRNSVWTQTMHCDGPWITPDWLTLAGRYSGVHVTLAAWLETAWRPIPVPGGYTVVAGWNPDTTLWLGGAPALHAEHDDARRAHHPWWTRLRRRAR